MHFSFIRHRAQDLVLKFLKVWPHFSSTSFLKFLDLRTKLRLTRTQNMKLRRCFSSNKQNASVRVKFIRAMSYSYCFHTVVLNQVTTLN